MKKDLTELVFDKITNEYYEYEIELYYNSSVYYNVYEKGFDDGYDYAVKTARLVTDNDTTYVIVYGDNDGNEYSR